MSENVWVGGKPKDKVSALHATMGCYVVNILSSDISKMMSLNLHLLVSIKCNLVKGCIELSSENYQPLCPTLTQDPGTLLALSGRHKHRTHLSIPSHLKIGIGLGLHGLISISGKKKMAK